VRRFIISLLLVPLALAIPPAAAQGAPQAHELRGKVIDEKGAAIAEAVCVLQGGSLPGDGIAVTTGEQGGFSFPGLVPGPYDLSCAAVGHLPVVQRGLAVTASAGLSVDVTLPSARVVRERVEVHETGPPVSQQSSAPPARLSSAQIMALPLVEEQFTAALPLVPGVVRTPDGKINIKGAVENQGMLLVDSAEMVDPITGSYSIDIPIDAVESVEVFKTPYRAEFGHFSGGLTAVRTKPPSDRWQFELNDLLPTPRIKDGGHIVGIADDSHRLRLSGPLGSKRLTFAESFHYIMTKQPVRGLAWPHNETKKQGFNSLTNLQYVFSDRHLATFNVDVFPMRQQFANINSLVPQSASSDYGQRGFSAGATDEYVFGSGAVLSSLVQFTQFSSYGHGQGPADMLITPNGWGGDFFNAYTRAARQAEAQGSYRFPRKDWHGTHEVKIGADFIYGTYSGSSVSMPVELLRADNSLAEEIQFSPAGALRATDAETGVFVQDHWAAGERLGLDLGLRASHQSIGKPAALGPRFGVAYAPGRSSRTILRGGIGVFFDRVPLLAGDFPDNPARIATLFDDQGEPLGPAVTYLNAYGTTAPGGFRVLPPGEHPDTAPYNLTWDTEVDRQVTSQVLLRVSYLQSRTYDLFVVDPQPMTAGNPMLLLTNSGGSRYDEFESTMRWRPKARADVNVSYVHSLARGDLNSLSQVYVPFEQPVMRPDAYANLPSDVPNRVVTWGVFHVPWQITASPVLDLHTGFPYSAVDVLQNYVGAPDSLRFPTFFSIDVKLSKDFRIPFVPWIREHKLRGALAIYNITNQTNPRDVYYNVASPYFGQFVGYQHRLFDTFLDVVY
jgi:Carboxypeptidase regulatory-like domain